MHASDNHAKEALVRKMTSPPPPTEEELLERPTSRDALASVSDDLSAEFEAESAARNKRAVRIWDAVGRK